jgi:hypothetical protein
MGEDALHLSLAPDLAHDIARDPAEIGADRPERPLGTLELLGVGIALMGDQRMFADPRVGLAKLNAGLPVQLHQPLADSSRATLPLAQEHDERAPTAVANRVQLGQIISVMAKPPTASAFSH